jgi:hypothetical protein
MSDRNVACSYGTSCNHTIYKCTKVRDQTAHVSHDWNLSKYQAYHCPGYAHLPFSDSRAQLSYEEVNHPAHYGGADNPYEVIKVLEAWAEMGMPLNLTSAAKYLARAGRKPSAEIIKDLRKAIWHIERQIAREESKFHG